MLRPFQDPIKEKFTKKTYGLIITISNNKKNMIHIRSISLLLMLPSDMVLILNGNSEKRAHDIGYI